MIILKWIFRKWNVRAWTHVAHVRDRWWALVNGLINYQVP